MKRFVENNKVLAAISVADCGGSSKQEKKTEGGGA